MGRGEFKRRKTWRHTPKESSASRNSARLGARPLVPLFMSFDSNTNHTDAISLVAFCQQWPFAALTSLAARAQLQAARLHDLASKSNGALRVIKYREDVVELLEKRRDNQKMVGGFLGIEGAHALDGDFSNVDRLYEYGFRVIGPSHFFDNELAGSAHGVERYGLTEFGKKCIRRMEELGIFVDLAHASQAVISDVLAMATRPVVVTHGGVQGFCNTSRTLSDDQLRAIAKTGGVVGIAYFEHCTCGQTVNEIALSIKYAIDLIGAKHVALGSDYDGSVVVPFDTTQLIQLTDALLKLNISKEDIRLVMGESTIQLLRDYLPSRIPGAVRV
ncbi:peptidase M19 [Capsaspora owczarzaki ATCC 30864]|uniref:Dipeptidase n=1 Tax=Capsaspora owczarzaki (strain ATCC 30864) TaxID=595528 RepID=A0A0D2VR05_CAPO3|nr:peptidase M19 [Capsaspora owczarzaki ATCC 30864]